MEGKTWNNFYQHTIPTMFIYVSSRGCHMNISVIHNISCDVVGPQWPGGLLGRSEVSFISSTNLFFWICGKSYEDLLGGALEHCFFVQKYWEWNVIIPTDVHSMIFRRGRLKPPTSLVFSGPDSSLRPCHWNRRRAGASPWWPNGAMATAWQSLGRMERRWHSSWMAALHSWEWHGKSGGGRSWNGVFFWSLKWRKNLGLLRFVNIEVILQGLWKKLK